MQVGDTYEAERTFTEDDVRTFAALTGDRGRHHEERDEHGRLMVHGLLVGSLPTKLGGDMDYIAREMVFEFVRPVWTGEPVRCVLTLTKVEPREGRTRLEMTVEATNGEGVVVMRGSSRGVVLDPAPGPGD